MADEIPSSHLAELIVEAASDADRDRRAQLVVDLSVVSLLIDAGICTASGFAKRLDDTQAALPERYQNTEVTRALSRVATKIQDYGPKG